jgi:hypothetical protein
MSRHSDKGGKAKGMGWFLEEITFQVACFLDVWLTNSDYF